MRTLITWITAAMLLVALSGLTASTAEAQVLKRLAKRAKEKVEQELGEKQDKAIEDAMNPEEEVEEEAEEEEAPAKKASGAKSAEAEGDADAASGDATAKLKPGQGAWANYDFVPGERILFAEDFSKDRVGNFPKRLELITGNAEVVDWNGRKWMRVNDETYFKIPLPENLPERFTVEFDAVLPWNGMSFHSEDKFLEERYNRNVAETSGAILNCCEAGVFRGKGDATSSVDPRNFFKDMYNDDGLSQRPYRARLQVDGKYMKMYLDEKRVANMPNGNFGRGNYLAFFIYGNADEAKAPLITNFSINAGGTPMYDALMSDGRFATQGILFDTGSDRIRPESTPTLEEIGTMLKDHADLKVMIEGHTDNTGDDAANMTLSEKRAAAVRAFLTSTHGIDAARLQSKGFGETKPAATNDTPEGRQQNRRVELVKL